MITDPTKRKELPDPLKKKLLSIDRKKFEFNEMVSLFGRTYNMKTKSFTPALIPRNCRVTLQPGEWHGNKEPIITTPGSLLYNILIIDGKCDQLFENHYFSEWPITANAHGNVLKKMYAGIMTGKMTIEQLIEFLNEVEFWGLKPVTLFSPSFTKGTTTPIPEVQAKKKEMISKLGGRKPTLNEMVEIEDTLVKLTKDILHKRNDPGATLYDSRSRGNWENDYKINNTLVGAVANTITGEFDFMESNYMDGIQKKDIPICGNIIVNGQYPKSVGTQVGGYLTKKFYAVFQSIVISSDINSDCGSKEYIDVYLTKDNIKDYEFRFILDPNGNNGRLIEITQDNMNSLVNKSVKMRAPLYCRGECFCSKCAGTSWARMQIENAGASTVRLPNGLLNASMKAFHNTKVTLDNVDPDKLII